MTSKVKRTVRKTATFILSILILCTVFIMIAKYVKDKDAEEGFEVLREELYKSDDEAVSENGYVLKKPDMKDTETGKQEELETEKPIIDLDALKRYMMQYPDMKGWITIDDTHIDYPIVSSEIDNEYYLHRDINGRYSSAGSIFLDNQQTLDTGYLHVIYGHHMKNHTMFRDVADFRDSSYYKEHSTGRVYTEDRIIELRPVYCYHAVQDGDYRKYMETPEEAGKFLTEKTGQNLPSGNYFVLVTCSYFTNNERTYLILKDSTVNSSQISE